MAFTTMLYCPGSVDAVVVMVSDVPVILFTGSVRLVLPSVAVRQFGPGHTPTGPCIALVSVIVPVKPCMLDSTTDGVAEASPLGRERE